MKCHYEVLEIDRDATDSEIKTAYKKLALKWHPDKNLDDPENAKVQFQEVQQAYEVLSDKHERAWYDNHREQILHGSNKEYQDNCLDLFQYFTSSCYKGYTDESNGFYSIYRNVFEQIAKEDLEFLESKDDFCEIPQFGCSTSDYETVVKPFYSYWMSYSTKRSYVWLDPYDIKEIRERKLLKLVEKENKKVRLKAKKERNEEVRNLVAFVRKRDKRVEQNVKLLEQKAKENKQKAEELSKMARKDRREQMNASASKQGEWTKFDNLKSELDEIEKRLMDQESNNSDDPDEDLYCVACNKVFRTPKAFQNHESSKKHKENLQRLKEVMLEEEEDLKNDEFSSEEIEDVLSDCPNGSLPQNGSFTNGTDDLSPVDDAETAEEDVPKVRNKKNKKNKSVLKVVQAESDEEVELESLKTKKSRRRRTSSSKEETSQREENVKAKKDKKKTTPLEGNIAKEEQDVDITHTCLTCKNTFSSKNKLFDHLKKSGHGVHVNKSNPSDNLKGAKTKGRSKKF